MNRPDPAIPDDERPTAIDDRDEILAASAQRYAEWLAEENRKRRGSTTTTGWPSTPRR